MDKDKKKKEEHSSKGGIPFGLEVLLFVLAIFVIWVLTGGAKKTTPATEKPFITPLTDPVNPGTLYGPEDLRPNPSYQQHLDSQYGPIDVPEKK